MMVVITLRQKFRVFRIWPRPFLIWKCWIQLTKNTKFLKSLVMLFQRHWQAVNYYHKALYLGCYSSPRSASVVIKKNWSYEPEKLGNIKKLHEKLLIPQNCGEICSPKLRIPENFMWISMEAVSRSIPPDVFLGNGFLKISSKFTEERSCRNPMRKRSAFQIYWNCISAWVFFYKSAAYFEHNFS